MQVVLIRHLPTSWNDKGYLQGKRDIPISLPIAETNRLEIEFNQSRLQKWLPFDGVFVSALKRTQQTAFAYGFDSPMIDPLLNELDFGSYEGKPKETLLADFNETWQYEPLRIELGESMDVFQERVLNFFTRHHRLNKILIFGHGSWIRALLSIVKYGDSNKMNQLTVKNNQCLFLTLTMEQIMSQMSLKHY